MIGAFPAFPMLGHHSAAMFDLTQQATLRGTVIQFSWTNPHAYLTVRNETNGAEQLIEVGPPATLQPLGLTRDAVRVGDAVSVIVHPAKRGSVVLGRELTKTDGSTWPLFLHPASRRAAPTQAASSLQGTWVSQGFFQMGRQMRDWPFTPKGRAHVTAQDQLQTSHVRCVPVTAPMLMLYPVANRIAVDDSVVRMTIDWMDSERVIYMDGRSHPPDSERSLHGHSVGRWEGATLVIDTTNFEEHTDGNFLTVPSSTGKHLVERLSLVEGGKHLRYEVTLTDPEWLAGPVTYSGLLDFQPALEPSGLPCDEEAARRFLRE
jgi:hypothetical protein